MKIVFRVVVLAALAILGVWLWTLIFPSPQKIIRQRLEAVARRASFAPDEGTLARLASVQSLASYFSTNVEIDLDVPGRLQHTIMGRDEITQTALAARSTASSLSVKFLDVNVTISPSRQSATADFTVEARVSDDQDLIVQEMKFSLRKINGQWLITRVETIRTLSIFDFERAPTPSIVRV
ncbi:MAG TPA: hypothetical protein VMA35_12255 [Candidatus Sulfopaludibacter sp.]|nr:hypothetical protein [Candidatus Sulfopaludibacter sp.]